MAHKGIELRKSAKSESIRIKFMYAGMECRETLKLAHTKPNINYAVRLRGEILNAIEKNIFNYAEYFPNSATARKFGSSPVSVTVGKLLKDQLAIAEKTLSPSTARGYKGVYESHLKPQFEKMTVAECTAPVLRAWIATLDCKLKTIRNILTPLRNAFDQAVNDDLIEANPLDRVKLTRIVPREKVKSDYEPDPFTYDEITSILNALTGQEKNFFQFAFATGMRTSELIALEWSSIDLVQMRIAVERVKVEGVIKDETKTAAGARFIDIRKAALDALTDQKQYTFLKGETVFHNPRHNKPWDSDQATKKRFMWATKKAGIRYRNQYQTRHTFASTLLSAGLNLMYVSKQMGHKNTEMLIRRYGRWIEQGSDQKAELLEFFAHVSPTKKQRTVKA